MCIRDRYYLCLSTDILFLFAQALNEELKLWDFSILYLFATISHAS